MLHVCKPCPPQLCIIYDIVSMCVIVVIQVCNYLNISCFTIPYPPPSTLNK